MGESQIIGEGTRIQSGTPLRVRSPELNISGLLLRGVVMATYVTDSPEHPRAGDTLNPPLSVYCDVVVYPSIPGQRWFPMHQVAVAQERGGLHNGEIWKPRATTRNLLTNLDRSAGANIAHFDGDHVLIGFLNNSPTEPIILKALSHPSRDLGNENLESGKRITLKLVDGDPDFRKHHGIFYGVSDKGDFVVDSRWGHDGTLLPDGKEPPAPTTGASGNQIGNLPQGSKWRVVFYNMAAPEAPVEVSSMDLDLASDTFARVTLGGGAVKVAIADHLEELYTQAVTGIKDAFATHKHPTGTGPSGTPDVQFPVWDSRINSRHLTIPDEI
jgi:hypothetical protein